MLNIAILTCTFSMLAACGVETAGVSASSSPASTSEPPAQAVITAEQAAGLGLIDAMEADRVIHPNIEYCGWGCDMGPTCVGWAHVVETCCYSGTCWITGSRHVPRGSV